MKELNSTLVTLGYLKLSNSQNNTVTLKDFVSKGIITEKNEELWYGSSNQLWYLALFVLVVGGTLGNSLVCVAIA